MESVYPSAIAQELNSVGTVFEITDLRPAQPANLRFAGFLPVPQRENRIRELAYYKWVDAGHPDNSDLDFWLQAESEFEAAERLIAGL